MVDHCEDMLGEDTLREVIGKIHTIVNAGEDTDIPVAGGSVPSVRKWFKGWNAAIQAAIDAQLNVFPILASPIGASLIGTVGGTVQAELLARPTFTGLLTSAGAKAIGYTQTDTLSDTITVESAIRRNGLYSDDFKLPGVSDYQALVTALAAAKVVRVPMYIAPRIHSIGANELVVDYSHAQIYGMRGHEIQGTGDYIITFNSHGGSAQPPEGIAPSNQYISYINVRKTAASAGANRTAIRLGGSRSAYEFMNAVVSVDPGSNGVMLESDSRGTGPYYTRVVQPEAVGAGSGGPSTGIGIGCMSRAGTTPITRLPNANVIIGGRAFGFLHNWMHRGNGNLFLEPTSENNTGFGNCFTWKFDGANTNVGNSVIGAYAENGAVLWNVESGVSTPMSIARYYTGIGSLLVDPGDVMLNIGSNGVRAIKLPGGTASGIYLGNGANADGKTFDWYEEDTWAPTLEGSTTPGSYTLAVTSARFTRSGNQVTASARIGITINTPGTGTLRIGGLPYNRLAGSLLTGEENSTNLTYTANTVGTVLSQDSATTAQNYCVIKEKKSATAPTFVPITALAAGSSIEFTVRYFA